MDYVRKKNNRNERLKKLRSMNEDQLKKREEEILLQIFKQEYDQHGGASGSVGRQVSSKGQKGSIKAWRHELARIRTIITEKQLKQLGGVDQNGGHD